MTTATADSRHRPRAATPAQGTADGQATDAERRLVLLLCGTQARRERNSDLVSGLIENCDTDRLSDLLGRLRLTGLVGTRLLALGVSLDPRLEQEILSWTSAARAHGRTHELTALAILQELESRGVRALALKGSVLAREVYGDVGVRSPGDIDILVAAEDLSAAVAAVARMGWTHQAGASRAASLPVLHESLVHPALPRVELHWRVHWYETRFAADVLARAVRVGPHEPLLMLPADGLAALILFYARDGFTGLRMPADAAAWWDSKCDGLNADQIIEETAIRYPELAAALRLGAEQLGALVGLPSHQRAESIRLRTAAQLATPFQEVTLAEARAKVGLVDLLLAPPGGARASLRREREKIPAGLERPLTREDDLSAHLARWEHILRLLRRWTLAGLPAAVRAGRAA